MVILRWYHDGLQMSDWSYVEMNVQKTNFWYDMQFMDEY